MTSKPFFEEYGIALIRKEEKTYVRFDAGGLVCKMIEVEVNACQADRLQQGEDAAYQVLLELERPEN